MNQVRVPVQRLNTRLFRPKLSETQSLNMKLKVWIWNSKSEYGSEQTERMEKAVERISLY